MLLYIQHQFMSIKPILQAPQMAKKPVVFSGFP